MDDSAVDSPAPSPAKGRGFASRRGVSTRGVARRNARGRPSGRGRGRGKGRGRHKTYDDARVQAAYERMKELRELYSEVANAVKPGLERLAEHNINQMLENPTYHEEAQAFNLVQQQLEDKLREATSAADGVYEQRRRITENQYHLGKELATKRFHDSFDYVTEEFYDGALNRSSILAHLRREDGGIKVPALSFDYVQEPNEFAKTQGPYVFIRNGIEVPEPSRLKDCKQSNIRTQLKRSRAGPKRKAEDVPLENQPDAKKQALLGVAAPAAVGKLAQPRDDVDIKNEGASTPRPRHIGGLLSAETEPDAEPESNAPSPSPLLEEGQTPDSDQKREASSKKEVPDLPAGASEPDVRGVRTVSKRGPKANNRIIIPPQFEFDEGDIGFRDSTNDSTRKATRNTRGKFLNKPNSRTWHFDQTIAYYNCLDYEDGDLDPEIVKKHNLHPKYGFFLSDSVNESETPKPRVDGRFFSKVVVTPDGNTFHASRTLRPKIMDEALAEDATKDKLASLVSHYTRKEDIPIEDITTDKMRERELAIERLATEPLDDYSSNEEEEMDEAALAHARITSERDAVLLAMDNTKQLLKAAKFLEEEQAMAEEDRPQIPAWNQRPTRPYDAVRDSFGTFEPSPTPPVPPVDTYSLSVLADVADGRRQTEDGVYYDGPMEHGMVDSPAAFDPSMIDPNLMMGVSQNTPAPPPNAFLQTALNPTPNFAHIAPAPAANTEGRPHTPAARVPFTNQGNPNQVLPPLRPATRRDNGAATGMEGPPPPSGPQCLPIPSGSAGPPSVQGGQPQEFSSPRGGILQTNTGNFYPPAPHRPFHQSYSVHEPGSMMAMPPIQQGSSMPSAPISSQAMMHNQPPPPPHMPAYPALSPPMQGPAQLAPMPTQITSSPISSTPPTAAPSPPAGSSRHRASIPSNGQNSGKYRKIAAAPIPHNRPWASNGGSELRLSNYDPKGSIKDYMANEPPPRSGPTTIRGWSVNNVSKSRNRGTKKEGSVEETESPK